MLSRYLAQSLVYVKDKRLVRRDCRSDYLAQHLVLVLARCGRALRALNLHFMLHLRFMLAIPNINDKTGRKKDTNPNEVSAAQPFIILSHSVFSQ